MKMRFIGKPDDMFPDLVTGAVYEVIHFKKHYSQEVLAWIEGTFCPYSSYESFAANWEEL